MATIHVLHENAAWAAPLFDALARGALPHCDWHLAEGAVDLTAAPPEGVFYHRNHPLLPAARRSRDANAVDVAAFEFTTDRRGIACTYDVNTSTTYNPAAEARAGLSGMAVLAALLGRELSAVRMRRTASAAAD
jgi:hypothetical protein